MLRVCVIQCQLSNLLRRLYAIHAYRRDVKLKCGDFRRVNYEHTDAISSSRSRCRYSIRVPVVHHSDNRQQDSSMHLKVEIGKSYDFFPGPI